MKPLLRTILLFTALGGVVLALWPIGQSLYAHRSQSALRQQYAKQKKTAAPKKIVKLVSTTAKPKPRAQKFPPTRIVVPEAELDAIVVRGVHNDDLRHGPGWMPGTALPGEAGNCVIAGHRNVYGSPFGKLDVLFPGSEIRLETPEESFRYLVVSTFTAADNDQSVIAQPTDGSSKLTLITCTTPKTMYRVIITAVRT
jgi:sortase A